MSINFFKILPIFRVKIKEKSMEPYLLDGDLIIATKIFRKLKVGDVIIFKHPTPPFIFIKRITKVFKNKSWVEGDNKKESIDSRKFGLVENKKVLGKMIFKI